jgi:hypothetical protein
MTLEYQTYVQIVGLGKGTNGRTCRDHRDFCGVQVKKGDTLYLKPVIIINQEGKNEYAIAAYILKDGLEACRVGFIAREFHFFKERYENKLVQVQELQSQSNNKEYRRRSHLFGEVAIAVLLN